MRVAVIAGTTASSLIALKDQLEGVSLILHAGRIDSARILDELSKIAPLHAVVGQKDYIAFGDRLPEALDLELCGARVVVTHMIGLPPELLPPIERLLERAPPDVIVHGHNPGSQTLWLGGTLFLCPGHAAPREEGGAASCAILEIEGPGRITAHVLNLDSPRTTPPSLISPLRASLQPSEK